MIYEKLKQIRFLRENAGLIRRIINPSWLYFLRSSTKPLSGSYGLDRGKPIDRFYIESYLEQNKALITGKVLELLDNEYSIRFGTNVTESDILDIDKANDRATVYADIRNMPQIPDESYDCIILTQVLQFIDDPDMALRECRRILKKGGSILITVPAVSRIDCIAGTEGDFWRFTEAGLRHLLSKSFDSVLTASYGNARSGMLFFIGASQEETTYKVLAKLDEHFPVVVSAIVKKLA